MPKLLCLCDFVIPLHGIPCQDQYMIFSDVEFDKFPEETKVDDVYDISQIVIKCPNCGRLHIFWNGFRNPQTIYKIE